MACGARLPVELASQAGERKRGPPSWSEGVHLPDSLASLNPLSRSRQLGQDLEFHQTRTVVRIMYLDLLDTGIFEIGPPDHYKPVRTRVCPATRAS